MPNTTGRHPPELVTRALVDPRAFGSRAEYRAARAAAWAALVQGGLTLVDIANAVGLTRERVRQILRAEGHSERKNQRGPGTGLDPLAIVGAVRDRRCYSPGSFEGLAKCSFPDGRSVLKELGLWEATERLWRLRQRRLSDNDGTRIRAAIVEALEAFGKREGRVPRIADAMAGAFPFAHTTAVRYFGLWSKAVTAAGFRARRRGGADHVR